jgi:beta-N-acetylhexosaminidase
MNLEEKVGQMLMTSFVGQEMNSSVQQFLSDLKPGGVGLSGYNFRNPDQIRALNRSIYEQMKQGITPFIAVDQEGGPVARLKGQIVELPGNMLLGATQSPELARRAGVLLGKGLYDYGFNMDLAPVLDIRTKPTNSVTGFRSYSSDPGLVSRLGGSFITGLQSQNVVAVGKHFPGHGDSDGDSHLGLVSISHGMKTLEQRELVPFRDAISKSGLDAVMAAHMAVPSLHGGRKVPTSLSSVMLMDVLRHQMGFRGIILADNIEMKGLLQFAGSMERAAVMAVIAGVDMIGINADPEAALKIRRSLLDAVRNKTITQDRIDESVRRILQVKVRHKILDTPHSIRAPGSTEIKANHDMTYEIALKGVTMLKNEQQTLPLTRDRIDELLVVGNQKTLGHLQEILPGVRLSAARVDSSADVEIVARRLKAANRALVVLSTGSQKISLVEQLAKRASGKVILVHTGLPYLVRDLPHVDAVICTYSRTDVAVRVALEIVVGNITPQGQLPVRYSRQDANDFAAMHQDKF